MGILNWAVLYSSQLQRRSLPGMRVDACVQDFVANELLLPIVKTFIRRLLNVQVLIYFHIYVYLTSSNHMHLCQEYDHKLTKQYNTQFTHSLLEIPDFFDLCVVEEPVACTNSSPVVPP